jgi:hypothetical protein
MPFSRINYPSELSLNEEVVSLFHLVRLKKINYVALVCERTIPTERPPLVGEVSANVCG